MARLNHAVGDWFAVPLHPQGFAVGLVARADPSGSVLLGYFFGPHRRHVPDLNELEHLSTSDAVLVCRFGYLGLQNKEWPILGRVKHWDPRAWPMPTFIRHEQLTGRILKVMYDDSNPNSNPHDERIMDEAIAQGPRDGLSGHGAVEMKLAKLLA